MLSIFVPNNVNFTKYNDIYMLQGPIGNQIKKVHHATYYLVKSSEGMRIFIDIPTGEASTSLASIHKIIKGLAVGWQKRLRLVGVGFRASRVNASFAIEYSTSSLNIKNYLRKRILSIATINPTNENQFLKLKIGFSHEAIYPIIITSNNYIKVSRADGRTKGIVIRLKSNDKYEINQFTSEIRAFRFPGIYKTKGIYFNKEVIKLKKGKRQS